MVKPLKMFEEALEAQKNLNKKTPIKLNVLNIGRNNQEQQFPLVNSLIHPDEIMNGLNDGGNASPSYYAKLIENKIDNVIDMLANPVNGLDYSYLLNNIKLLQAISYTCNNIKNQKSIYSLNELIYNLLLTTNNDPSIREMVIEISNKINRDLIEQILGINYRGKSDTPISHKMANYISMCRRSSIFSHIYIQRVNFLIGSSNNHNMFINIMEDLYKLLFPNEFDNLFVETMTDTSYLSEDGENFIPSIQINALLNMLQDLSIPEIDNILKRYSTYAQMKGGDVRCSLHSLSEDYRRIKDGVSRVTGYGFYIP